MGSKQTKLDKSPPTANTAPPPPANQHRVQQSEGTQPEDEGACSGSITRVQCLEHTSVPMPAPIPEHPTDPNPDEDVSMYPAPHPEHIPLHEFCANTTLITPVVGVGAEDEEEIYVDFCVKLMPHHHTLFCERRVCVCGCTKFNILLSVYILRTTASQLIKKCVLTHCLL